MKGKKYGLIWEIPIIYVHTSEAKFSVLYPGVLNGNSADPSRIISNQIFPPSNPPQGAVKVNCDATIGYI